MQSYHSSAQSPSTSVVSTLLVDCSCESLLPPLHPFPHTYATEGIDKMLFQPHAVVTLSLVYSPILFVTMDIDCQKEDGVDMR